MFATLPDFTPRDSHSLWYTSSRNPFQPPGPTDSPPADQSNHHHHHGHGHGHSRQRGQALERSALARLAQDEQYLNRRKLNVQNYGSSWLRPPGIPKTLHQMREEKREQEEHQEAMRREQLAQELAEAEGGETNEDGLMDDVALDGAQDLDDDIPDADDHFAMDDDDDDDDDEEEDNDEEEGDGGDGEEDLDDVALRQERQNDLMAARMRMTDDAFREALVRGDPDGDDMYGGGEELEEEDKGNMLDEDDFPHDDFEEDGVDMDADLDDDIPEAESGGYEHTDSEAELSSSEEEREEDDLGDSDDEDDGEGDDDDAHIGFMPRAAPLGPPQSPTLLSRAASGPRASMDISLILSQDESSLMDSSPVQSRRARQG